MGEKIRIALLADLHIGSAFAMWPPGMPLSSGGHYKLNKGQQYLLENWRRLIEELPRFDMLIIAGDGTDGKQPAVQGRFIIEPEPLMQARALLELLQPLLKKQRRGGQIFILQSSRYHDEDGAAMDFLGQAIGAEKDAGGHYSHPWLLLEWNKIIFDIAHSQSFTIRYRGMPLEREGQFSDMAGLQADAIIRAHTHACQWQYIEGANRLPLRLELSLPALQLQSAFAASSKTPNRLISRNLGMVLLEASSDWIDVRPYLFPHPPLRRITIGR